MTKRQRVSTSRRVITRKIRPEPEVTPGQAKEALRFLSSPEFFASATAFARRVAETLPQSLEQLCRSSENASKAFTLKREQVEQEIRRGANAIGPDGKQPSGRLLPRR